MSLYRKYRPQNFENLVGQNHVRITLMNALKADRVNHAYLFTGPRGTGKTSTARILAKAVNCLNLKDSTPCEECDICRDISEGRLIDLIEIDAASNRGIDEIRDLREKINFAPTRARSKVYIIDEVHMLTKEAFNALLKTLEEPPSHVYFILATTEVHKIPETILSRCQRFDFKRIDDQTMVDRLQFIASKEGIDANTQALEVIANHSQGGLRDAIGLLEQLTTENKLSFEHVCDILGVSGYASIEKMYGFLLQKDTQAALNEIHNLYIEGYDLIQFNKNFLEYLRRKMIKSVEEGKNAETAWILSVIGHFQEAYEGSRYAVLPQLPLELAVVESCLTNVAPVTPSSPVAPVSRDHKGLHDHPVKKEAAKTEGEGSPLSFDTVKEQWPRIAEHIKTPAVKRSFQESALISVEGFTVTLAFATKFHMEKILETEHRLELEKSFSDVFRSDVKIIGELKKVSKEISKDEEELAEKVADIFDGAVVQE